MPALARPPDLQHDQVPTRWAQVDPPKVCDGCRAYRKAWAEGRPFPRSPGPRCCRWGRDRWAWLESHAALHAYGRRPELTHFYFATLTYAGAPSEAWFLAYRKRVTANRRALARQRGMRVELLAVLDLGPDGRPHDHAILATSGHLEKLAAGRIFRDAAGDALKRLKFDPVESLPDVVGYAFKTGRNTRKARHLIEPSIPITWGSRPPGGNDSDRRAVKLRWKSVTHEQTMRRGDVVALAPTRHRERKRNPRPPRGPFKNLEGPTLLEVISKAYGDRLSPSQTAELLHRRGAKRRDWKPFTADDVAELAERFWIEAGA